MESIGYTNTSDELRLMAERYLQLAREHVQDAEEAAMLPAQTSYATLAAAEAAIAQTLIGIIQTQQP